MSGSTRASRRLTRARTRDGSRLTLVLETPRSSERDHDIAATLDAIRKLVESEL